MLKNVFFDSEGISTVQRTIQSKIRNMEYWDEKQNQKFIFLTNAFDLTSLQIALLYKNRWQVELFFKWFKTASENKKVFGNYRDCNENPSLLCYHIL